MLYRYGGRKNSGGWDFGKQSERYHMPTLIKSRLRTNEGQRVISFGADKGQNYNKFNKRVIPGSSVWVVVWSDRFNRFRVEEARVSSVFYFNYDNNGTLWNVWLDNYYHNTGLLEDSEYFLTRQRAQWFLDHKLGHFAGFKENQEWWRGVIAREKTNQIS